MQEGTGRKDAAVLTDPGREKKIKGNGVVTKISMHSGLEGLKVERLWKEGGRARVPLPRSHGNKHIVEWTGTALVWFDCEEL